MNFLKKKLKTIQGKRNKDDDDDFDNYIPEVPPHPSVNVPHHASTSLFDNNAFNNSLNFSLPLPGDQPEQPKSPDESKLSLEELKAREEEHKRLEKEKLKQQEEGKRDNADWQFFLSLTAKVDAVTSATQSTLEKFKDDSAVKDIAALEEQEEFGEVKFGEEAPKAAGGWVAFEENAEFNASDPIFYHPKEEPKKPEESVDPEKAAQLEKQLLADFGFGPVDPFEVSSSVNPVEEESKNIDIDPFDTSAIDIDAIRAGKVPKSKINPDTLLQDFDIEEVDPFDTSHIESAIATDLTLND